MKGIKRKILLAFLAVSSILILMVWLFQVVLVGDYYIAYRMQNMKMSVGTMAKKLDGHDFSQPIEEEVFERVDYRSLAEHWILIMDTEGNVYYDSIVASPLSVNRIGDNLYVRMRKKLINEIVEIMRFQPGVPFTYIDDGKAKDFEPQRINIHVGSPFKTAEGVDAFVYMQAPITPIQQTINMLKKQFNLISMLVFGVAVVCALLFARYLSNPILRISSFAKQVAKGDYEARVCYQSNDEVGELATTLNDMAYQLGQTEKLRQEFIANTTHDLKTPISAIRADAELLLEIDGTKEQQEEFLKSIIDEALRLNDMVEEMLRLSEMEAGKQNLAIETFNVSEMLQDIVDKYIPLAEKQQLTIKTETPEELLMTADAEKIYRAFDNVISNAIKYTPAKGNIKVTAFKNKAKKRVEISDTGIGIPKKQLPHVWERFYRGDKSRGNSGSSNGLGLSIVKQILEAHQFNYGINSEENIGTTVWVEW